MNNKHKTIKHRQKQKAKRVAGIEGQVATMLESYTRQTDTLDTTAMKRTRKRIKKKKKKKKNNLNLFTQLSFDLRLTSKLSVS